MYVCVLEQHRNLLLNTMHKKFLFLRGMLSVIYELFHLLQLENKQIFFLWGGGQLRLRITGDWCN